MKNIFDEVDQPKSHKMVYLKPNDSECTCVSYNHLDEDIQNIVLKEMNIPEDTIVFTKPCNNYCFQEDNDPEIAEFLRKLDVENKKSRNEFSNMVKTLRDDGMDYEAAFKQSCQVLYGIVL